jgi:hypothetical protein
MKTLFKILFVLCLPLVGMAQGNLQFNRVIFTELTTSTKDSVTILVPQNKVLKIESAIVGGIDGSGQPSAIPYAILYLNDKLIASGYTYSGAGIIDPSFPIWLPAGSYKLKLLGNTHVLFKGAISAIEFNITP